MAANFHVSLAGRRILITGASKGLGAHFARTLADAGAHVAVAARDHQSCVTVCAHITSRGGRAVPVVLDVSSADSTAQALSAAWNALGGLDTIINNAGVTQTIPLIDQDEAGWDRIMDTNVKGSYLVAQAGARLMREHKLAGAIINVASILGHRIAGQVAAYAASKAALVHLTQSMALEWARFGIRVNALCPGYIATDLNRDFLASEAGQALMKRIPQRRFGTLEDLEGPLLFLCSDAAGFMTGTSLIVDGGHLISSL